MKEQGLFRTKLFGGFNKKDVFEYFEVLSKITPSDVTGSLSVFSKENAVLSVVNPRQNAEG